MDIDVVSGDPSNLATEVLVLNVFEGESSLTGSIGVVDSALNGAISDLIQKGEIKGAKGECTLIHTLGKITPSRVLVVGLGKADQLTVDTVRFVSGEFSRFLNLRNIEHIVSLIHGAEVGGVDTESAAQAVVEGATLGLYTFNQYKTVDGVIKKSVKTFLLLGSGDNNRRSIERGVKRGLVLSDAVSLARDMVNEPANEMTPTRMAAVADRIAAEIGLEIEVLEDHECRSLGMGGFLGIAQGSNEPPKFIVLRYKGDPDNPSNSLGLIGKGITFDTGGISLKSASGMGEMKSDMSGGASVIAAMQAIGILGPKVNVTAIVAATENMPGGSAVKPADILRIMNGKTVEIENTDAEGRVTLADAICYAKHLGLQRLVDVATLTGAIITTFGKIRLGVFGNDRNLIGEILKAGEVTGERMWQLPMDEEYREQNHSTVADVKNTGGSGAGSITAAHFIQEFVGDTPWVHLDIAGVALSDSERGPNVKGATGIPVRSLVYLALQYGGSD